MLARVRRQQVRSRAIGLATTVTAWMCSVPLALAGAPDHGEAAHPQGIKWFGWPTEEDPRAGFVFVLINFVVLFFVLHRVLFKPLMASNAKKSDDIREQLDKATLARTEAEGLLTEYRRKLERADAEIAELKESARTSAEVERKQLLEDARVEAQRIIDTATRTIERETKLAVRQLEGEVVDKALERAESMLRSQFGDDDQRRLVQKYVTQVGEIDPARLGKVS